MLALWIRRNSRRRVFVKDIRQLCFLKIGSFVAVLLGIVTVDRFPLASRCESRLVGLRFVVAELVQHVRNSSHFIRRNADDGLLVVQQIDQLATCSIENRSDLRRSVNTRFIAFYLDGHIRGGGDCSGSWLCLLTVARRLHCC